ncbi:hypothetical protein FGO68_gene83 [Halteria grandinella]|uniref:BRCT domain-containing protein n=1 Tax=Halteria grandinella TaxID=5974 RepID=A0A8J8NXM8_HALGN|nr:hypothetical protein FGO68_gene83 [Halteria grandinella]
MRNYEVGGERYQQRREAQSTQEPVFRGIRALFLNDLLSRGGRHSNEQAEEVMRQFRDHGGRTLNVGKIDSKNYMDALKWVDYLVIDDNKLSQRSMDQISDRLQMPQEELQKILQMGTDQKGAAGIQVINSDWVQDCLDSRRLLNDKNYLISLPSFRGKQRDYDDDEDEYRFGNEDTAYSRKARQNRPQSKGRRLSFDEGHNQSQDQEARDKRARSLKRIGTQSPFRNKDGSLDRRRVNSQNRRRGGDNEELFGTESEYEDDQRRSHGQSKSGHLNKQHDRDEFRNKDGSLDRRRVVPRMLQQRGRQQESDNEEEGRNATRTQRHAQGRSQQNRLKGQEDEDFHAQRQRAGRSSKRSQHEMVNKDGTEDLRKYGPFNVDRAPTGKFVPKGSIRNPKDTYPDSKSKSRQQRGANRENQDDRRRSQSRRSVGKHELARNKDGSIDLRQFGPFNVDRSPSGQLVPKGSVRNPVDSYDESDKKIHDELRKQGISKNEQIHRGAGSRTRRQTMEESEEENERDQRGRSSRQSQARKPREGKEDLRRFGPFNVDRAPTGQLVPKGSIAHPIQSYPDSKTKLQRNQNQRGSNEDDRERRGQGRGSQRRTSRQGGDEDKETMNKDGTEDLRKYGPFNVARAPTGQFVPKGSIKNPIEEFESPEEKIREQKGSDDEAVRRAGQSQKDSGQQRRADQSEFDRNPYNRRRQDETDKQDQRQQNKNKRQYEQSPESDDNKQASNKKRPQNERLTSQLESLMRQFEGRGDNQRKVELQKAVNMIRQKDMPIEDLDHFEEEFPEASDFIKEKVEEFFERGQINKDQGSGKQDRGQEKKESRQEITAAQPETQSQTQKQ